MVGAKFQIRDGAGQVTSPGAAQHRLRWIAIVSALVPLSFVLVQCGKAPSAGMLAANSQASAGDTFLDRFPTPQFKDLFPTANESFEQRQPADAPRRRAAQAEPAPYRGAAPAPTGPPPRARRER